MTVAEDVHTNSARVKAASEAATGTGMVAVGTRGTPPANTMAVGTAAQALQLKRGEFAIAVHLGLIRLTVRQDGGRPRVRHDEVDRLRSQEGFPEALRARVCTVGTAKGAQQLGIGPDRFTRLARAGCFTPITFYVNRYRAIVWLYLADELAAFAGREPQLLVGRSPAWLLERLEGGADYRARNWRSRRVERLLSLTGDPWARAAVLAETLDPVQLAEVVDDPYERAHLAGIRPEPAFGPTGPPLARETMAHLMRADEPDEMLWRRVSLIMELDSAREARPAPSPGGEWRDSEPLESGRSSESDPGAESIMVAAAPDAARVPAPVPLPSPVSVSVPAPGPTPEPVPFVAPRPGAEPDSAHVPQRVPEPALGLLARLGLRRRATKSMGRQRPGRGSAPYDT
ncbi:DUF6397 family protein [Streptomyces sp. NPDC057697]|uniref:DUF6397 family protein n=1 Tax=Streptomyces sp. NPDC057697 TaxID=3346219 RepID=UPI003679E9DC